MLDFRHQVLHGEKVDLVLAVWHVGDDPGSNLAVFVKHGLFQHPRGDVGGLD